LMAQRCEECGRFTVDADPGTRVLCARCAEAAGIEVVPAPAVVVPTGPSEELTRVPQVSTGFGCFMYVAFVMVGLWALVNVLGVEQTHGAVTALVCVVLFGWPMIAIPLLSPRLARWIPPLGKHPAEDDLGWDFGCGLIAVVGMLTAGLVVLAVAVFAIPVVLGVLFIVALGWGVIFSGIARRL